LVLWLLILSHAAMVSHNHWVLKGIVDNISGGFLLLFNFLTSYFTDDVGFWALKDSFGVLEGACCLFLDSISSFYCLLLESFLIFFLYFIYLFNNFFDSFCSNWCSFILNSSFG